MVRASTRGRLAATVLSAAGLALAVAAPTSAATTDGPVLNDSATLWTNPNSTTVKAAATLTGQDKANAELLAQYPTATWLTSGTPQQVQKDAKAVVNAAHRDGDVPVIVAYNLPYRDCAQYSGGGAADTAAYEAWIDGLARGIGNKEAVVILEPDGLGIIPNYTSPVDQSQEWCHPKLADGKDDPNATSANRFTQLNYAVDALARHKNTAVYLDGTHSAWQKEGEISSRLVAAGVRRTAGFFLNVSNYQTTDALTAYGERVSKCLYYATTTKPGSFDCADQYSGAAAQASFYSSGWLNGAAAPSTDQLTHFVLDTSRNGQGPWSAPTGAYADPEVWCNPPLRGLGLTPTTRTGNDLVDAYLWIKVPGESDGQCYRGTAGPQDPARNMVDPAAGQWFPEQAAELIELADPKLG